MDTSRALFITFMCPVWDGLRAHPHVPLCRLNGQGSLLGMIQASYLESRRMRVWATKRSATPCVGPRFRVSLYNILPRPRRSCRTTNQVMRVAQGPETRPRPPD